MPLPSNSIVCVARKYTLDGLSVFSDNLGIVMNLSRPLQLIPLLLFLAGIALAADVSGKWNFQVNLDTVSGSPTFTFKQDGEKLTGTYSGQLGSAKVSGSVKGDSIEFSFEAEFSGDKVKAHYTGKIESSAKMSGSVDYAGLAKGTWTAEKAAN
jgi:hypothetical protein